MSMTEDLMAAHDAAFDSQPAPLAPRREAYSLRQEVERSLQNYFEQLDGDDISGLYDLVLAEVEAPLLEAVLRHTGSNQSKASIMLGLNRGTLRKKLKLYGLL